MATAALETVLRNSEGYEGTVDAYEETAPIEVGDLVGRRSRCAVDDARAAAERLCGATARCVERHPFQAMAVTAAAAFLAGAAIRLIAGRRCVRAAFRDA